jgi:hypothetical protein
MSGRLFALTTFSLGKELLWHGECEAGWATEPVWTFWMRQISVALTRKWTPNHPSRSSVTILAMIFSIVEKRKRY